MDLEKQFAKSMAHFTTVEEWQGYKRGVQDVCSVAQPMLDDMLSDHMENARILEFLCNELQGRIEGGKLQALFGCLERSRAAIAKATGQ